MDYALCINGGASPSVLLSKIFNFLNSQLQTSFFLRSSFLFDCTLMRLNV